MPLFLRVRVVNDDARKPSRYFPTRQDGCVSMDPRWEPAEEVYAAVHLVHVELGYKSEEQVTRSQQHEETRVLNHRGS